MFPEAVLKPIVPFWGVGSISLCVLSYRGMNPVALWEDSLNVDIILFV